MLRLVLEAADFGYIKAIDIDIDIDIQQACQPIVDQRPSLVLLDRVLSDGIGLELSRRQLLDHSSGFSSAAVRRPGNAFERGAAVSLFVLYVVLG